MKRFFIILCAAILLVPSCKKDGRDSNGNSNAETNTPKYSTEGVNAVDLGLSVLWADRNIGAESPEDPGHYFAWGETTAREFNVFVSPYIFDEIDAPQKLTGQYDNATELWGDGWRMPTKEELLALQKLTHEEKKDSDGKVIGATVTGNGNSIYIPTSRMSSSYMTYSLWSSERGDSQLWANFFDVFTTGISNCRREYAHAVRPVKDK